MYVYEGAIYLYGTSTLVWFHMTESNNSAFYLDLLLSIGREVNFALPFTTSVTIIISKLQTFRSRVATSYLTTHPIRQGLLFFWMFYSEGGAIFQ